MTLKELANQYIREHELAGKSPLTIKEYSRLVNSLADNLPEYPTADDIMGWLLKEKARLAHNGYWSIATRLKQFANAIVTMTTDPKVLEPWETIRARVKLPTRHDIDISIPTTEEVEKLIYTASDGRNAGRDHLAMLVWTHLGLRVGELCQLTWDDVDFGKGLVHVGQKHGRRRMLPIIFPERLLFAFTKRYDYYLKKQVTRQTAARPHYVMNKHIGQKAATRSMQQMLETLCAAAGIQKYAPHSLRYYFAGTYARHVNIRLMQRAMGHANIRQTLEYIDRTNIGAEEMAVAFGAVPIPEEAIENG